MHLAWLLCILYIVSYLTRNNFSAIISEMESAMNVPKSLLSLSLTASMISYGAGQILSGYISDRVSPKLLIIASLIATSVMNILIPLFPNPYAMLVIWCINGLAQSFMWPPMVKIMLSCFSAKEYGDAMGVVAWGSSLGTIAIYLISPIIISLLSWKFVFLFAALAGVVMTLFWCKLCPRTDIQKRVVTKNIDSSTVTAPSKAPYLLLGTIMLAICAQGMLRDGVTTWMPSFIKESFSLSNEISILTGVALPIFAIISIRIAQMIYRKIPNPLTASTGLFCLSALASLILSLFPDKNPAISITLSAIVTGCMHGINIMLICMIPNFFEKNGKESLYSGMLNSCTYVGSATFTYGIAMLTETKSWSFVILIWAVIAAVGAVLCAVAIKPFYKKYINKS